MHTDDVVEPSNSPWRSQPLVMEEGEHHKRRFVVDFSQTINIYTLADAYPLPRISDQVNEISKFKIFSHLELTSAYYQIPLKEEERAYTAFEADGKLWQFKRVPMGVTNANGGACLQRGLTEIVDKEQ